MTDDDQRTAFEVAADVVLLMRSAAAAGLDDEGVASTLGAYGPHFDAVARHVGARAGEQANAGADTVTLLRSTTIGITAGVGMYTAGAVLLADQLLAEVVRATGRDAGAVIAEILERSTRG